MAKKFVEAGCKAFAFAEGKSVLLKVQAQKNTQRSQTGVMEGHFETVEQALAWLKEEVHIQERKKKRIELSILLKIIV